MRRLHTSWRFLSSSLIQKVKHTFMNSTIVATTYQQNKDIATKTAMSTEEKLVPKPLSKPLVLRGCCCCRTYFENPWPSCPRASFGNVLKAIPEWRRKPPFPKPEVCWCCVHNGKGEGGKCVL